ELEVAVGIRPETVAALGIALALQQLGGFVEVELVGRVLLQQVRNPVDERLEAWVTIRIWKRKLRHRAGATKCYVDELLTIDRIAERPAQVLVAPRGLGCVDVERCRPPIGVAIRRVITGPAL